MGLIKKTAAILSTALTAATAGVAVKNALGVKTDEEVGHKQGFYEKYVKRPQDFFCASAATIALSPVLAATALLVRTKLGSPVLFTQDRPGEKECIFKLFKFRSMTNECDEDGALLPESDRLTSFGRFLRKTSLDELPELFSIVRGDMSLVGPRPLLVSYLQYYKEEERHRHDVKPGLSGLAQINGRSFISWEEIFDYDLQYVNSITFLGDLKIIFKTLNRVVKRVDVADYVVASENEDSAISDGDSLRIAHKALDEERGANNA